MNKSNYIVSALFLTTIFFPYKVFSSTTLSEKTDSLFQSPIDDTLKLKPLIGLAWNNFRSIPDEALDASVKGIELAKKSGHYLYESKFNNLTGTILSYTGNYDSAQYFFEASLKIGEKNKHDKIRASALGNLGLNQYYQGQYDSSLAFFFECYALQQKSKDSLYMANTLANIGSCYSYLNESALSLKYNLEALELFRALGYQQGIANAMNSIGGIYADIDSLRYKALDYYLGSLEIKEKLNDQFGISNAYIQLGSYYFSEDNFEKAFYYLDKAYTIKKQLNDESGLTKVLINSGVALNNLNRSSEAISYLTEAIEIARKIGNNYELSEALNALSTAHKHAGNPGKAYEYRLEYEAIKENILNKEKSRQIIEMQTKYDLANKEQEIKLLQIENQKEKLEKDKSQTQFIALAIVVLMLGVIGLLLFNRYRLKQFQLRKLAVIKSRQGERTRIANDMHDDIGSAISRIALISEQAKYAYQKNSPNPEENQLVQSLNKLSSESRALTESIGDIIWMMNPKNDTLNGLMAFLRNYSLEYLEEAGIDCTINFPDQLPDYELSPQIRRNIYLSFKEALHNIIKHADASHVLIKLEVNEGILSMTITDNGKGLPDTINNRGNGLRNMEKRMEDIGASFYYTNGSSGGLTIQFKNVNLNNYY